MDFKIGIGVIIKKSGMVLLGKRIGSHGAHTWSFPGGHVDNNETPETAAKREVLEETGLIVNDLAPLGFTYDHFSEVNTDYLTLFYCCNWTGGTPQVMEANKCLEWRWFSPDELPEPLFTPIAALIKQETWSAVIMNKT
ncbi:MAG TPA: NUDIX domain-containing protein [Niastella sp.]